MLVDKRLGDFEDVQGLMNDAQRTGRQFNVYDVDAPLEMSLVGVLMRQPGGADPIPPFHVVAEGGFVPARANRDRSMALFEGQEGASVGKYEVFGTTADGRKVRVAEVVNGERIIHDRDAFRRMQEDPQLEVDRLRNETIDDAVIERVVGPLPKDFGDAVRAALEPYKGRNWDAALTEHGRPRQSQDAGSGGPRRPAPDMEGQGPRTTESQSSLEPPRPSSGEHIPQRNHPRVEDGNLKEGWEHIDARHVTGHHPKGAGDLFAPGTTRAQVEQAIRRVIKKGRRLTPDGTRRMQTFEHRVTVNGQTDVIRVTVDSWDGNRVITAFPARGGVH